MEWSVGITTVPSRRHTYLPRTLDSLKSGGFTDPWIFVDMCDWDCMDSYSQFRNRISFRNTIKSWGHWVLTAWEMYLRNPWVDRYLICQDDFVCVKNLRQYLESVEYPEKGYCNLYTFPENYSKSRGTKGWFKSNQRGLGAVCLMFTSEALQTMFQSNHFVRRSLSRWTIRRRGKTEVKYPPWKFIDGGIVDSFRERGWSEYTHNPSLVQHIGNVSSMQNGQQKKANSFPGEIDILKYMGDYNGRISISTDQPRVKIPPAIQHVNYRPPSPLADLPAATNFIGMISNSSDVDRCQWVVSSFQVESWLVTLNRDYYSNSGFEHLQTCIQLKDTRALRKWILSLEKIVIVDNPSMQSVALLARKYRRTVWGALTKPLSKKDLQWMMYVDRFFTIDEGIAEQASRLGINVEVIYENN